MKPNDTQSMSEVDALARRGLLTCERVRRLQARRAAGNVHLLAARLDARPDAGAMSPTRISAAGLAVLQACLGPRTVAIHDLVRRSQRRPPVARASLSRTLRRLWRAGLVELTTDWGTTLTEHHAEIDDTLAAQERDPEAAFAEELDAVRRGVPGFLPYTTADEWLGYQRSAAARRKRGKPMRVVCLTSEGRALVERLTSRRREVNQSRTPVDGRLPSGSSASPGAGMTRTPAGKLKEFHDAPRHDP